MAASDNYQSLVLWSRRIRERIITIENSRPPIARLSLDLLQKVPLHDIDSYFASGGTSEKIWKRREDLRLVMRKWRDAIDCLRDGGGGRLLPILESIC